MPYFPPAPVNLFVGPIWASGATAGNVWPTANAAVFEAFQVNRALTVSTANLRVITQSGNIDIGVYDAAGNRLTSTGSVATPAASVDVAIAFTSSVPLAPGVKYWLAVCFDNAVASISSIGLSSMGEYLKSFYGVRVASFPLPASVDLTVLTQPFRRSNAIFLT